MLSAGSCDGMLTEGWDEGCHAIRAGDTPVEEGTDSITAVPALPTQHTYTPVRRVDMTHCYMYMYM